MTALEEIKKPLEGRDIATLTNVELVTEISRLLSTLESLQAEENRLRSIALDMQAAYREATARAEAAEAEVRRYRVALIAAKTRMRNCRGAIESDQVVDKDVHGSLQNGIRDIQEALASTGGEHHAE